MKNSVILLGGILFLSIASCKTKKSQQVSSTNQTTTTTTTTNSTTTAYNTSEANIITQESPTTGNTTATSTETTSANPKKGATTKQPKTATESGSATNANETSPQSTGTNPKKGTAISSSSTELETTTGSPKNTNPKNPKTATESSSTIETQPTVYNTVTDQTCAAEVAFGSPGSGIDGDAFDKIMTIINNKKVAYTSKNIGREGEKRICLPLTELKDADKKDFLNQLKKIAKEGQYVSLSIR